MLPRPVARQQQDDVLSEIARKGVTGAKYIFDWIDYPNKWLVRPALAGKHFGESASGGDILNAWGLRPSKDALGGWGRPIADLGVEAVTDISNLVSFGGKSAAGAALKRAGMFDNAVASAGRQYAGRFADDMLSAAAKGTDAAEQLANANKVINAQSPVTKRAIQNFDAAGLLKNAPQRAQPSGLLDRMRRKPLEISSGSVDDFAESIRALDEKDILARPIAGKRSLARTTKLSDVVDLKNPTEELLQATGRADSKAALKYLDSLGDTTLTKDIGVRLPFSDDLLFGFNVPGLGGKMAGGLDIVGDALRWGPVGRAASSLVDQSVMGRTNAGEQILAKQIFNEGMEGAKQGRREFQDAIQGLTKEDFDPKYSEKFRANVESGKYGDELTPALRELSKDWQEKIQPGWLQRRADAGLSNSNMTQGGINYFPRQAGEEVFDRGALKEMQRGAQSGLSTPDMLARKDYMGEFEGGTEVINKLSLDKNLAGRLNQGFTPPGGSLPMSDGEAAAYIIKEMQAAGYKAPSEDAAVKLARSIGRMSDRAVKHDVPLFGHSWAQDMERYIVGNAKAEATANRYYDLVARQAKNSPNLNQIGHESVGQTAGSLGLQTFNNKDGVQGAAMRLADRLGVGKPDDLANFSIPTEKANALRALAQLPSQPGQIETFLDNYIDPVVNMFKQSVLAWPSRFVRDWISGVFTNAVEVGTPADVLMGYRAQRHLMHGEFDALLKDLAESPRYAAFAQANDTKGFIEQIQRDLVDSRIVQGRKSMDMAGRIDRAKGASDIMEAYRPGMDPTATFGSNIASGNLPWKNTAFERHVIGKGSWEAGDWLKFGGTATRERDVRFPLFRWSAELGDTTDSINRAAGYFGLLRQGVSPEEAGRRMLAAHIDYSTLTDFERRVMRRIFPFWSYQSRIGKYVVDKIADNRGGRYTQMVLRPGNRDDERYTPADIRSKYGISLGGDDAFSKGMREWLAADAPEGTTPWLSDIDLPGVSVLNNIQIASTPDTGTRESMSPSLGNIDVLGSLSKTGLGMASDMSPILKEPIEFFTGTSTFNQRPLRSQYSPLQRIAKNTIGTRKGDMLDEAAGYIDTIGQFLPLYSRSSTALSKLTDTERVPDDTSRILQSIIDNTTGVKIRNIDANVEESEALRQIQDMLENDPLVRQFQDSYIYEDDLPYANPSTLRLLELARELRQRRRERAGK